MPGEDAQAQELAHAKARLSWNALLPFCIVVLLAMALRCWGIGQQSVWRDEYLIIGYLDAVDFNSFLSMFRFWNADNAPLFQLLAYAVYNGVCASTITVRMLSVAASTAAVALLYLLVQRWAGQRAAIIAALLAAISPHHIWYAQAIRPYALLEPLSIISWWTLLEIGARGTRRFWLGHIGANLLLIATHPFSALMFPVQGLYLLPHFWRNPWHMAGWLLSLGCGVIAVILWVRSNAAYVFEATYDHFYLPSWHKVLFDFLGDDAVMRTNEFAFPLVRGPLAAMTEHALGQGVIAISEWALLLVSLTGMASAAIILSTRKLENAGLARFLMLCLLLCLLPSLLLLLASYTWRPIFETRYTTWCTFALYGILGVVIARIPMKVLRVLAAGIALVSVGFQLALFYSGETRPDWNSVATQLRQEAKEHDRVFVGWGGPCDDELLAYAMGVDNDALDVAYSTRALCAKAQEFLGATDGANAWVVVADQGTSLTAPGRLGEFFESPFYRTELKVHPGTSAISVYRVSRGEIRAPGKLPELSPQALAPLLYEYAASQGIEGDRGEIEVALNKAFDSPIPTSKWHYFALALALYDEGEIVAGRMAADTAHWLDYEFPPARLAQAMGMVFAGNVDEAWAEYASALTKDQVWLPLYEPLMRAALADKDAVTAAVELERLEPLGFPYRPLKDMCLAIFPDSPAFRSP